MGFTDEHKQKIGSGVRASWTEERRKQYSESRRGANNPFFQKTHSDETKRKIKAGQLGEKNQFFGKTHSETTIAAISKSKMGKSSRLHKYGITDEQYKQETEAGRRWCFYRRHFVDGEGFSAAKRRQGVGGVCIACSPPYQRELCLSSKYGVTVDWYDAKLAEQDGGCAICHSKLMARGQNHLAIDHCHRTNIARGILCHRCNSMVGWLEKPGWLDSALAYLARYKDLAA